MIAEENQICSDKDLQCFNTDLKSILTELSEEYQERQEVSMPYRKPFDLPNIYKIIKNIGKIDEMNQQINVIKQIESKFMMKHETHVK